MPIKLPYSLFESFTNQLVWNQLGREYPTGQCIEISEKVSIRVLRATWRPADERLFLLHQGILYLEEEDLLHLKSFPGIDCCPQSRIESCSGLVSLSGTVYKSLQSCCDLNNWTNVNEYLFSASARGNQSFAFGHFVSELLPDLVAIQQLSKDIDECNTKVIAYPLEDWASQLLDMFGIRPQLVSPLPRVPVTSFPTYTSYKFSGRLYRNTNRALSIASLLPSHDSYRTPDQVLESLVVLSRASAGPSRPMRWINIDECVHPFYQESFGLQASIVDPAVNGPFAFRSTYLGCTTTLFVSAPGSAVFNVLYLTSCPILIALDAIPRSQFWEGQLADLRPYGHRIIFIANHLTDEIVEWDKPFSLHALPDKRYLNTIFKYMLSFRIPNDGERFSVTCGKTFISLPLSSDCI